MHRTTLAGTVAGLAALALLGTGAPAPAAPAAERPVAQGLLSPLSLAVGADGTVYYTQNFAGTLHARAPGKKPRTLVTAKPGDEVGGVSVRGRTVWGVGGTGARHTSGGRRRASAARRSRSRASRSCGEGSAGGAPRGRPSRRAIRRRPCTVVLRV